MFHKNAVINYQTVIAEKGCVLRDAIYNIASGDCAAGTSTKQFASVT